MKYSRRNLIAFLLIVTTVLAFIVFEFFIDTDEMRENADIVNKEVGIEKNIKKTEETEMDEFRASDEHMLDVLLKDLDSHNEAVRERAGERLEDMIDPRDADMYLSMLEVDEKKERELEKILEQLDSQDEDVRKMAMKSLENIMNSRDADEYKSLLKSDKKREYAVLALEYIGDPRAVDPLTDIVSNEEPSLLQENAINALGEIGDPRAVESLLEVVENEERYSEEAIIALGKIGDPGAVETLIDYVENKGRYQEEAIWALGEIGDPRAVDALIEIMQESTLELSIRGRAVNALGEIGDPRAVEPLLEFLEYKNSTIGDDVIMALGKIGDPRAVEPLEEVMITDSDFEDEAREALEMIKKSQED